MMTPPMSNFEIIYALTTASTSNATPIAMIAQKQVCRIFPFFRGIIGISHRTKHGDHRYGCGGEGGGGSMSRTAIVLVWEAKMCSEAEGLMVCENVVAIFVSETCVDLVHFLRRQNVTRQDSN
jgi:hypothetical protein